MQEHLHAALVADAPNEQLKEKLNLFGQFIGEWDFEWIGYNSDGTAQKVNGEWIFDWGSGRTGNTRCVDYSIREEQGLAQ